jgi:hypothetical protein
VIGDLIANILIGALPLKIQAALIIVMLLAIGALALWAVYG